MIIIRDSMCPSSSLQQVTGSTCRASSRSFVCHYFQQWCLLGYDRFEVECREKSRGLFEAMFIYSLVVN